MLRCLWKFFYFALEKKPILRTLIKWYWKIIPTEKTTALGLNFFCTNPLTHQKRSLSRRKVFLATKKNLCITVHCAMCMWYSRKNLIFPRCILEKILDIGTYQWKDDIHSARKVVFDVKFLVDKRQIMQENIRYIVTDYT